MCVNNRVESSLLWLFIIVKQLSHAYTCMHTNTTESDAIVMFSVRHKHLSEMGVLLGSYRWYATHTYVGANTRPINIIHLNKFRTHQTTRKWDTINSFIVQSMLNSLCECECARLFSSVSSIHALPTIIVRLLDGRVARWWLLLFCFYFYLFWFAQIHFVFYFSIALPEMCVYFIDACRIFFITVRVDVECAIARLPTPARPKWTEQWICHTYFNLFPLKCHFHTSFVHQCESETERVGGWVNEHRQVRIKEGGRGNKPKFV